MAVRINIGVAYNGKNIQRSWADLQRLAKVADTTSARIKVMGAQLQLVGRTMAGVGESLTKNVTLPIVAVGAAALRSSVEFDSAFTGVIKTVNATEEQLASLRTGIRQMATEMPATAAEIANVASAAGQLGIATDNILAFTKVMVDLGETTNLTADEAATQFARFANIMQTPQDEFDRLGSVVVALGNNLATTEAEILQLGLRLSAAGNQVGLTEQEVLAFAAALSSVGVEAEAGGTAFSRVFLEINTAVLSGTENLAGFARIAGMTSEEFSQNFRRDAAGAVTAFVQGLRRIQDAGGDVAAALADVGFEELRTRDALGRAAGAGDLLTNALGLANEAFEANIALAREADLRYQSTGAQFEIFRNRVNDVGIELGDALAPALLDALDAVKPLIDAVKDAAAAFAAMPEEQQQTILKMIGLVAIAGPAVLVLGNIATAVGVLTIAFGGLSAAMVIATGGLVLVGAAYAAVALTTEQASYQTNLADARYRDAAIAAQMLADGNTNLWLEARQAGIELGRAADAARYQALANAYAAGQLGHLATAGRKAADETAAIDQAFLDAAAALEDLGDGLSGGGGVTKKVVALSGAMRTSLQEVNLLAAGMENGGEFVAQFARELLTAGSITDETAQAASRLAQVVKQDVDRALADANRTLEEAQGRFDAYRDSIAEGVSQGNTLADAAGAQAAAVENLARAEEEYQKAVASGDPARMNEAAAALRDAERGQGGFLDFLTTGLTTAEGFAAQIDSLRLAGASLEVVQQIAELGARTGGRIASELLAGGAAAIAEANRLVLAVEAASKRAGEAAAQQFFGAGVESARRFVSAVEATIPELQSVLDRIADMIGAALGTRPDVDISGRQTFISPQAAPQGGNGITSKQAKAIYQTDWKALSKQLGGLGGIPALAEGGLVRQPTLSLIGEAGPEVVIPLDRLGQMGGGQTVINVTVTSADPQAVVEAIRRYTRQNGPLGGVVTL